MIPLGWHQWKLGELLEIKHGFAFKSTHFNDVGIGYKLLTPAHFREEGGFRALEEKQKYYDGLVPNSYLLSKGALLIAMTEQAPGLLGSPVIVPESGVYLHNQRLGLIIIQSPLQVSYQYLFHILNMPDVRKQISTASGGTKVKHTSPQKIKTVIWPFPPLVEQGNIVKTLNQWDAAIDFAERLIDEKRLRRKGLMQQLPTGKRRLPGFEKSKEVRRTRWGNYPADWGYPRIGEIAKHVSTKNQGGASLPVLSCTKHRGLVDSMEYFGKQVFSKDLSTYKVVQRGQFAYATNHIEEGSIGYQNLHDAAVISPMYTVFEAGKKIDDRFLFLLLKTELYRHIFEVNTSASVDRRGSLRWPEFSRLHVPLPTLDEQREIVKVISVADREIELLQAKADVLRQQKKGLMQQLLTGKKRVKV
ncbi:MAG: hypothetical protein A2521_10210 [Deltaproteobacteria bacterium RIFOXYD12_FULL_57_12]|nr:MAG: hypothetical protein A2521_10210 [Deltaproteobacteria bacterium RIFOXYD12_FULL_57_12]